MSQVLFLGDYNVGKTTIILSLRENKFCRSEYSTLGISKNAIMHDNLKIEVSIFPLTTFVNRHCWSREVQCVSPAVPQESQLRHYSLRPQSNEGERNGTVDVLD